MKKEELKRTGAYHFINYRQDRLKEYLKYIQDDNSVICFDLEDSIQDVFQPERNSRLKQSCRDFIKDYFFKNEMSLDFLFGLRLNSFHSDEFAKDIDLLLEISNKTRISSLFLTKAESITELTELNRILDEKKINCDEIVAVIETKKGFDKLTEIVSVEIKRLKKIAFGHCDFNLDNGIFPFHHQNSAEYWEWIDRILKVIVSKRAARLGFINSPYLELDDDEGFLNMLSGMRELCKEKFFQITLTHNQTRLCREQFSNGKLKFEFKNENILDIKEYALKITKDFNDHSLRNSFVLSGEKRKLISPHEFKASENYLRSSDEGN